MAVRAVLPSDRPRGWSCRKSRPLGKITRGPGSVQRGGLLGGHVDWAGDRRVGLTSAHLAGCGETSGVGGIISQIRVDV